MSDEKKPVPTVEQSMRSMSWQVKVIAEELAKTNSLLAQVVTAQQEQSRIARLKGEVPF